MRRYVKKMSFRLFKNEKEGGAPYGNLKLKPYDPEERAERDVIFRAGTVYRASGFVNDDGSIGITITEAVEYEGTDSIADNISQDGFKPIAEAIQTQYHPAPPAPPAPQQSPSEGYTPPPPPFPMPE